VSELHRRRAYTAKKLAELRSDLSGAERLITTKACVYATGSYGRGEAGQFSDLDVFIVGKQDEAPDGKKKSALSELDATCVKADLIRLTREHGIQEFSGDGRYLTNYSAHELIDTLGKREDDVENAFTARLLLLLESCALVESDVHEAVLKEVIGAYWRDYDNHADEFMPAFLSNDILRLWRTFCVNYEAQTQRAPADKEAERKLKNFKLKHSRMLTCYSAILHLLATYQLKSTVSPEDALAIARLPPTVRLEQLLLERSLEHVHKIIRDLVSLYEQFLETTNAPEADLVQRFQDKAAAREYTNQAYRFGDLIYEALAAVAGKENRFYRLLIV
jgi:Nucleotidyltransferase domain